MRHSTIALCALAVIGCLAGCSGATADWSYTAFDNFDPSQVSMLPSNPYDTAASALPYVTAPEPQVSKARVGR
ncbi:MAG TPA: hypothetical protein VF502_03820 [Stellaceae bacterium]